MANGGTTQHVTMRTLRERERERERELLLTSQNFLLNRLPSSVGHFQVSIARPALSAAGSSRSLHQAVFLGESEYRVDSASVGRV